MFIAKKSNDAITGICYITRAREEIVSPYLHLLNDVCTIYIIYIIFNRDREILSMLKTYIEYMPSHHILYL